MTTPAPPDAPVTQAGSRWRRLRPRGAGIGAALLAVLIVGGVAAALLVPGSGVGLAGESGELGYGLDAGPGDGPRGDGIGHGGGPGRGLGDDTLLAGTVVSTAEGSIVITPDGDAQRTLRTDGETRVRGNGNAALGTLQPGERVVIRVSGTGDSATAITIMTPRARVTGTVTELSGDTATVVAFDGLTVTANVAALAEKPAVGDLVVVSGVAADATTITADAIRVLPKAG